MSDWRLFTGITGLLGQYLLCDSLQKREPACVLVRGRRGVTPSERVDLLLCRWEKRIGRILPRPVVLEGDLRTPGLEFSNEVDCWFRQSVKSIVHCAASVLFQESPSGEPMKSNVDGTRHLLEACRGSRVRDFHYVSTAYSCGQIDRSKPVREEMHPVDGPFGNIYERSKCLAEHLVAESEGDFTRTIYRPSIIIGERDSGYSPSFNAIYTPLRLASMMFRESDVHIPSDRDFLDRIGLHGTESRSIVPVDWVSRSISAVVRNPMHHGGIYHLTNPAPTQGQEIIASMARSIAANLSIKGPSKSVTTKDRAVSLSSFSQHMQPYRSYFQSDPVFENSRFNSIEVCLPCPRVDEEVLVRNFDYAIRSQFESSELAEEVSISAEPRQSLDFFVAKSKVAGVLPEWNHYSKVSEGLAENPNSRMRFSSTTNSGAETEFDLFLSGSGGGCWNVIVNSEEIRIGLPGTSFVANDEKVRFVGSAAAFREWLEDKIYLENGISSGRFVITGPTSAMNSVRDAILRLRTSISQTASIVVKGPAAEEKRVLSGSENVRGDKW